MSLPDGALGCCGAAEACSDFVLDLYNRTEAAWVGPTDVRVATDKPGLAAGALASKAGALTRRLAVLSIVSWIGGDKTL